MPFTTHIITCMATKGQELVAISRSHLGAAFYDHYAPDNLCSHGTTTIDSCMEKGLGKDGQFDCSGLVIAGICEVLKMRTADWPRNYRHANQLAFLEERCRSNVGDIVVLHQDQAPVAHLGILTAKMIAIHASRLTNQVEEGTVLGQFQVRIIPLDTLLEIGFEATHSK